MDKQYIIEITFNKVKQSLHIRRIKDVSIPVTCVGNNDATYYPTTKLIPSNMSLDYLFEVAKAEHQRNHKAV
jgi:hypothetical protein